MRAIFGLFLLALLPACGDDDDGGGDEQAGGASSSPLSNLFKGFGSTGSGDPAASPTGASEDAGVGPGTPDDLDAGADTPPPPMGGAPAESGDYCALLCERVFECLPAGCPNFTRLTEPEVDALVNGCRQECAGITREVYEQYTSYACEDIAREIRRTVPDVEAYCSLVPVSDAECEVFCTHVRECGWPATDEQCESSCVYADGVHCILENGCRFAACQQPR